MSKKSLFWGLLLVLAAVNIVLRSIGIIVSVPIFKIIISVVLLYVAVRGLIKTEWFEVFFPLAFIVWLFEGYINEFIFLMNPYARGINGMMLFAIAFLLTIGLSLIIKRPVNNQYCYTDKQFKENGGNYTEEKFVYFENSFSSQTKYVKTRILENAKIKNNFGQLNVYFDNATISAGRAVINVDNNFGETNIYLPSTWRMETSQKTAFGNVSFYGMASIDESAPIVRVNAAANFGQINIHMV